MHKPQLLLLLALAVWSGLSQAPRKAAPSEKFKAIWEPVNYPQDASLRDVFFVSAEVGWAVGMVSSDAGEGGVILHTIDGGQHWDVQLGDPHSATRGFEELFFLDAKHGWATQGGSHLLRTTDGETWEEVGELSAVAAFTFATPEIGFFVHSKQISRTADSGRSWKQVYFCRDKVEVNGLTQEAECEFHSIACPTPQLCYAATQRLPNKAAAIAKSEDGGLTWKISSHVPEASGGDYGLLFTDVKTGFMRGFAEIWSTVDGGENWRKVPGTFPGGSSPRIHFARPRGGLARERHHDRLHIGRRKALEHYGGPAAGGNQCIQLARPRSWLRGGRPRDGLSLSRCADRLQFQGHAFCAYDRGQIILLFLCSS